MGLDLILYKRIKPMSEMTMEEEMETELAYGRKTWAIARFFTQFCKPLDENDYEYLVTKSDWDYFIEQLARLEDETFREKVEDFIDNCENESYFNEESFSELYQELEDWLDSALNTGVGYMLGLEWELRALLEWYDANDEVQKAFKEKIIMKVKSLN